MKTGKVRMAYLNFPLTRIHKHADLLLVKAGSGVATLGLPDSPGVTEGAVADIRRVIDAARVRGGPDRASAKPAREPSYSLSRYSGRGLG